jgi:hypothetical protein
VLSAHDIVATHIFVRGAAEKLAWDVQMRASRHASGVGAEGTVGSDRSGCVDLTAAVVHVGAAAVVVAPDRPINRASAGAIRQSGVDLLSRISPTPGRTNRLRASDHASPSLLSR